MENDHNFLPIARSIIVSIIVGAITTVIFGNGIPAVIFKGILLRGSEAAGQEVGKTVGDGLKIVADKLSKWAAERQRQAEIAQRRWQQGEAEGKRRRKSVLAPPAQGYAGFCGIAPDNLVYCCNDQSTQFYIQYEGDYSPFAYAGVRYARVCYR